MARINRQSVVQMMALIVGCAGSSLRNRDVREPGDDGTVPRLAEGDAAAEEQLPDYRGSSGGGVQTGRLAAGRGSASYSVSHYALRFTYSV